MLVYIIVNENEAGERNVLGAFTEEEKALTHRGQYAAEYPAEECWIETFDTEEWAHEMENEYKVIHRTMVSKTTSMSTHVIFFSKEELPLIEEGQEWYTVQQENKSFDEKEGKESNLRLLRAYLQGRERK